MNVALHTGDPLEDRTHAHQMVYMSPHCECERVLCAQWVSPVQLSNPHLNVGVAFLEDGDAALEQLLLLAALGLAGGGEYAHEILAPKRA